MPNLELKGEPTTGVAIDIIERLLPEWWSRFQSKNSAYGGVLAQGGGLGIKAFIPEINRKVAGIINEVWHGEVPQGGAENAREKAMDLIGHLLILISNLDANKEGGPRVGHDKTAIVDQAFGASRAARLKGEDGKAAGIAKVQELMVQTNTGEPVDTSATFLTVEMSPHVGIIPPSNHEELVKGAQAAIRTVNSTHTPDDSSRPTGPVRFENHPGFKTVEQLQAERWPNKALEDPVMDEQLCGNPGFHSPHVYHNLSHEYGPIDSQCPGRIPKLGISGADMLRNAEHNLVYLRRAFAGGDMAGLPKNCSFEGHHRAHNWEVPAIVTGAITTYFCNGNAPYSDDNPGPERL